MDLSLARRASNSSLESWKKFLELRLKPRGMRPSSPSQRFLRTSKILKFSLFWMSQMLSASCVALLVPQMEWMPMSSPSSVLRGWITTTTCTLQRMVISRRRDMSVSCSSNFLKPSPCSDSRNCSVSITTTCTLCFSIEYTIVDRIFSIECDPQKFMKCSGSRENLSAKYSYFSRCLSSRRSANWQSMEVMRISLRISKLPQRTVMSFLQRSSVIWLRKVVLPLPVGPDITDSSPIRTPLTTLLKKGSQDTFTPQFSSVLLILEKMLSRRALKLSRLLSGIVRALNTSSAMRSGADRRKSLASFSSAKEWRTTAVRLTPSFSTILEVLSVPASSLSIHSTIRSKRARQGRKPSERLEAPCGRESAGRPVCWQTAIASNSPSVMTTVLSESLTRLSPKKPFCAPAGSCRMYFLFCLPAPRTFSRTISVQLFSQWQCELASRLNSARMRCFCSSSCSTLQAGKQTLATCTLFPSVLKNSSVPAPRLYAAIVASVKPRECRYSTTSLYSYLCMFARQKKNSASEIFVSLWEQWGWGESNADSSRCSNISCVKPRTRSRICSQEPLAEQRKQWKQPCSLLTLRAKRLVRSLWCGFGQKGQYLSLNTVGVSMNSSLCAARNSSTPTFTRSPLNGTAMLTNPNPAFCSIPAIFRCSARNFCPPQSAPPLGVRLLRTEIALCRYC